LAIMLHFALFNGSHGYVLKPAEMRVGPMVKKDDSGSDGGSFNSKERGSFTKGASPSPGESFTKNNRNQDEAQFDEGAYWPPPRERLHSTTIVVTSLHNLPKRGEHRPKYDGRREAAHKFAPELSGWPAPPDNLGPSSPAVIVSLHPVGGFCAVSKILPLPHGVETELCIHASKGGGMNAVFNDKVHCVAAEPLAVFVRLSLVEGGQEVAYESAVLGRLRGGCRVFQLRSVFGTRIELCFLFVRVSFGSETNLFSTPRQLRIQSVQHKADVIALKHEVAALKDGKAETMLKGWATRARSQKSTAPRSSEAPRQSEAPRSSESVIGKLVISSRGSADSLVDI